MANDQAPIPFFGETADRVRGKRRRAAPSTPPASPAPSRMEEINALLKQMEESLPPRRAGKASKEEVREAIRVYEQAFASGDAEASARAAEAVYRVRPGQRGADAIASAQTRVRARQRENTKSRFTVVKPDED